MANGILKDEATYFNDSETYTGDSGSETNKWVIEDVYDFVEGTLTLSGDSQLRLVNDIDFREHPIYKTGFYNSQVVFNFPNGLLDGDEHTIKNVVLNNYESSDVFMPIKILKNTNFVNLIMNNCTKNTVIGSSTTGAQMLNCNFGIYASNCSGNALPLYASGIEDCCFNIKGTLTTSINVKAMKRTHVNLDELIISGSKVFYNAVAETATNCYFTGKLKNLTALTTNNSISSIRFSNSYIAIEYDGNSDYSGYYISGTGFIDKELWCKNGFTGLNENPGTGKVVPVTTAQAQDADYLNSIGFAVVPVS